MNRHRIQKSFVVAAALALPVAGDAIAGNKVYRALDGDRVLVVTHAGKPPYSHRIVKVRDLSAAEFERFQATQLAAAAKRKPSGSGDRVIGRSGTAPAQQVDAGAGGETAGVADSSRKSAASN